MTQLAARLKAALSAAYRRALAIRFRKFLFVFDLRQGAILIATQNMALAALCLIVLMVSIAHALDTMRVLYADMEDNAEREGTLVMGDEDVGGMLREGQAQISNNQKQFQVSQHLGIMMVFFLYTGMVGVGIYLVLSVSLFYGAIKRRKELVIPWVFYGVFSLFLIIGAFYASGGNETLLTVCGNRTTYWMIGGIMLACQIYFVTIVTSFALELTQNAFDAKRRLPPPPPKRRQPTTDEMALVARSGIKTISYGECEVCGADIEVDHV